MKSKRLLDLMAKGHHTADALVAESGLSREDVMRTLVNLRYRGYIQTAPEIHTMTPEGEERQKFVPKPVAAKTARKRGQRQPKREINPKLNVVDSAIKSRPALATVWGALA